MDVERGLEVEDRLAVLDGHDPPGGERLPVADPVDLVDDGDGRVAGSQEVGVERVDPLSLAAPAAVVGETPPNPRALDGAPRRHQGLAGHLAAEHPGPVVLPAHAPEEVDLQGLEVEQGDELLQDVHRDDATDGPLPSGRC